MGIVEARQSFTVSTVHSPGVVETVRFRRGHRNRPHHEPYPQTGVRVDNINLSIEAEQGVEGRITLH